MEKTQTIKNNLSNLSFVTFVILAEKGKKEENLLEHEHEIDNKLLDEDKFYLEMMSFKQLSRKILIFCI